MNELWFFSGFCFVLFFFFFSQILLAISMISFFQTCGNEYIQYVFWFHKHDKCIKIKNKSVSMLKYFRDLCKAHVAWNHRTSQSCFVFSEVAPWLRINRRERSKYENGLYKAATFIVRSQKHTWHNTSKIIHFGNWIKWDVYKIKMR